METNGSQLGTSGWVDVMQVVTPIHSDGRKDILYVTPWQLISFPPEEYDIEDGRHPNLYKAIESNSIFTYQSRTSLTVQPEQRVTFNTFVNAFPACYWRRWTDVSTIRLVVQTTGKGRILLFESSSIVRFKSLEIREVDGDTQSEFEVSLKPFGDAGYIWFDLESAADEKLTLRSAVYQACTDELPKRSRGAQGEPKDNKISVGITTYNRVPWCINQLKLIAEQPGLSSLIDRVYVIDQGSAKVSEHPDFQLVQGLLGDKLNLIIQDNLGGVGGFSRALYETQKAGASEYCLLLDDDATIEPESIPRMLALANFTHDVNIVGGHMFFPENPTEVVAHEEKFDFEIAEAGITAPDGWARNDYAIRNRETTPDLHRRFDTMYNAWWMCLIPRTVIDIIGLPIPTFINSDDVAYGVNARQHGIKTITLPGALVWHEGWMEKVPEFSWNAYFMVRNNIISDLLYAPDGKIAPKLISECRYKIFRSILTCRYSAAATILLALEDVMKGPEYIASVIRTKMPEVKGLRNGFCDAQSKSNLNEFPELLEEHYNKGLDKYDGHKMHDNAREFYIFSMRTAFRHYLTKIPRLLEDHPDRHIKAISAHNWEMMKSDSFLLTAPDGSGYSWLKRDRSLGWGLSRQGLRLIRRLKHSWPELVSAYRGSDWNSKDNWEKIFFPENRK